MTWQMTCRTIDLRYRKAEIQISAVGNTRLPVELYSKWRATFSRPANRVTGIFLLPQTLIE